MFNRVLTAALLFAALGTAAPMMHIVVSAGNFDFSSTSTANLVDITLSSQPTAIPYGPDSFGVNVNGTVYSWTRPGFTVCDISACSAGFAFWEFIFPGASFATTEALFEGSSSSPTLKAGTFPGFLGIPIDDTGFTVSSAVTYTASLSGVPEPGAWVLMASGLAVLFSLRRRQS